MSTESVLAHHLEAFSEGVDAIMEDYDDESVLFTPEGPLKGRAQIRAFFEGFLADSPPELIESIELDRRDVVGDSAYIVWSAEPFIPVASDTFLVRDGTIRMQSFALLETEPRRSDRP